VSSVAKPAIFPILFNPASVLMTTLHTILFPVLPTTMITSNSSTAFTKSGWNLRLFLISLWNGFYQDGNTWAQGGAFIEDILGAYEYFEPAGFVHYFNTTGIMHHTDIVCIPYFRALSLIRLTRYFRVYGGVRPRMSPFYFLFHLSSISHWLIVFKIQLMLAILQHDRQALNTRP
jgi:hypothetical protein